MKMITRCPSCGTAFRIYQAQLDARQGQVRCGHCAVVFSAHEHLVVEPEASNKAKAVAPTPPPPVAPSGLEVEPTAAARSPSEPTGKAEPPVEPAKETRAVRVEEQAPLASPGTAPRGAADNSLKEKAPPQPRPATPAAPPARKQEPVELTMADATQFDFGPAAQAAQRTGPWWTVATVALIVLLFLQGAYLFRTELARALPVARPALERVCGMIGCEVPYPQEATLISLEASDLEAVPGGQEVLRLSAVLRNRATFAQAFPAIELTLTDDRNITVARRVLRPRDYLPQERPTVFAPTTELPLDLHIDAAGLGASGYRLYVFYP